MDSREDNGPSEALDVGEGEELENHNEQKEMMKMTVAVCKKNEDKPSVSLMCKYAAFLKC